ncbi:unnamed protein product [Gadus morhua 'NCC']
MAGWGGDVTGGTAVTGDPVTASGHLQAAFGSAPSARARPPREEQKDHPSHSITMTTASLHPCVPARDRDPTIVPVPSPDPSYIPLTHHMQHPRRP